MVNPYSLLIGKNGNMTAIEKYDKIFESIFEVGKEQFGADFSSENVEKWDSVIQLSLVSAMEEEFDLMLDTEDILNFTSYEKGKEILRSNEVEI